MTWSDGHLSVYPFELLRAACPCASCRGGHENMKSEPDADVFEQRLGDTPATRITNVVAVGSYALTIVWEDGHDYGIFNWHYPALNPPFTRSAITTVTTTGPNLSGSTKQASAANVQWNNVLTYTIVLRNSGQSFTQTVRVTDTDKGFGSVFSMGF